MTVREAAHITHDISADANMMNTLLTLAGGVVSAAVAGVYSGGTAALAAGALGCSIGGNIGVWIDKAVGKSIVGKVEIGVRSILVGAERKPAASNDQATNQAGCHGRPIAEGSKTVHAEKWNFARRGDQTMCGHIIVQGCPTVMIGGAPSLNAKLEDFAGNLNKFVNLACQGAGLVDAKGRLFDSGAALVEMAGTATDNNTVASVGAVLGGGSNILKGGADRADGVLGVVTDGNKLREQFFP